MLKNSQKLRIRLLRSKYYRTQELRVGSVMLWPYPYPLQGIFEELTKLRVGFELSYRTHRSSGGVTEVLQNPQKFEYGQNLGEYPRYGSVGRTLSNPG